MFCSPFSLSGWLELPLALLDRLRGRHAWRERTLLVVRHAAAERRGGELSDYDRALTEAGRVDAERLGALLARRGLVPEVMIASPARRADETAHLIASAAGFAGAVTTAEALYPGELGDLRAAIRSVAPSVRRALLVGHDPSVSALVARLAGRGEGLPPGGIAVLSCVAREWAELAGETARMQLVALWRPADTRAPPGEDAAATAATAGGGKWLGASTDERVVDVAMRALDLRFAALDAALARALAPSATAADDVRRVRVAGRRAEAVLRAFRDLLPRKSRDRLVKDLRRLRRITRRVRDDDLLIACIEPRATEPCVATLLALLRSRRFDPAAPLAELRAALADGGRSAKAIDDLKRGLVRRAERRSGGARFGAWALARYEESKARYAAVASVATTDPAALHDLRLAGKKLRYEIELLASVLSAAARDDVYPALVERQDRLGVVSDQASAIARLEELVAELDTSHPRDEMLSVVAFEGRRLDEARAAAAAWLREKEGQSLFFGVCE